MTLPAPLGRSGLAAYGALRAPLALLELPLFVLLPAYYAERLGLELVAIGSLLFAARAIDAIADPVIGASLDRNPDALRWRRIIWLALPVLVLAYAALFLPPRGVPLAAWLAVSSVLTYVAWSVVSIAYQAWGARLGASDAERVRVTSWREGAGLLGVLASAALLVPDRVPALVGLFALGALTGALLLARAPLPPAMPLMPAMPVPGAMSLSSATSLSPETRSRPASPWSGFLELWRCAGVRWTLGIFLVNGIASAIPATLLLFFVADILKAPESTPQFLLAYFLAAALGMPLWGRLATRYGLKAAWLMGMALSILAFIWAWGLGPGDGHAFFAVCIATGLALGADLAVPPALLAKVLAAPDAPKARDGAAFGLWNLATKLNLAAAAGLALPALGLLGYAPGTHVAKSASHEGTGALAFMYAVLPCVLKLLAALLLALAPLARRLPVKTSTSAPSSTRNT